MRLVAMLYLDALLLERLSLLHRLLWLLGDQLPLRQRLVRQPESLLQPEDVQQLQWNWDDPLPHCALRQSGHAVLAVLDISGVHLQYVLPGVGRIWLSELPQLLRDLFGLLMDVLVALETTLLALLTVVVAGLLRTHADILRALSLGSALQEQSDTPTGAVAVQHDPAMGKARDVVGETLDFKPTRVEMHQESGGTLIGFLTTGCLACIEFWEAFKAGETGGLPPHTQLVLVTKEKTEDSVAKLRELAPSDIPVVMSSAAWSDFGVPGAPYFVWVDGPTAEIRGVGSANRWGGVLKLLNDAFTEMSPGLDAEDIGMLRAGIRPGDSSLYAPVPVDQEEWRG